jgi:hypothetical protein
MTDQKKYYNDYPKEPIGGRNPYYCCSYCGKSDPEINGEIKNHHEWCEYRILKELMKEKAKEVLYAYMDVEKDLSQPKILIHTFRELINQLQVSPGVIMCADVLELCEELETL